MTKQKQPKAYTAPHEVYVSGVFHKPGDVFVTDADKEDSWTEHKPADAQAIDAATQKVPADVPLDDMDVDGLRALAATKHVNSTGMSKKELIAAIKAANEPKL